MTGRTLLRWAMPAVAAVAVALAVFLLQRQLRRYSLEDIARSVTEVPAGRIAAAAFFTAMSYLTLGFFDYFGIRYAGKRLPWLKVAPASFSSLAIGHNVGFAAVSTGALRLRYYTRMGLGVGDVARVIVFCATTVGLGLMGLAAAVLLLAEVPAGLPLSPATARGAGAVCAVLLLAYLAFAASARGSLKLGRWIVPAPPLRLALMQLVIGPVNFACVAAALYNAVAVATDAGYLGVVVAYVMGVVASLVAHVPGGLGVLEAVVLLVLTNEGAIGGLILFRVVYFLVPLVFGLAILAVAEAKGRRRPWGALTVPE